MMVFSYYKEKGKVTGGTWTSFNGVAFATFEPEEMATAISEFLATTTKAESVYITHLSDFWQDLIATLWRIGFTPIKKNPPVKKMHEKDLKYLINGDGTCYNITIKHNKRAVTFIDYNNIIKLPDIDDIITTWASGIKRDRPIQEQYAYAVYNSIILLNADCKIKENFPTTISAYSRRVWKNKLGFWTVNKLLPDANKIKVGKETLEQYCRKAYHGGINLARGEALTQDIIDKPGYVLDVNSLYSYVMYIQKMPIGEPEYKKGKPGADLVRDAKRGYKYFFVRVKVSFDLLPDGVPCICLSSKDKDFFTHKKGWLETSRYYNLFEKKYTDLDNGIELTLTQTDFFLMLENYQINKLEYIDHVVFNVSDNLFKSYVSEFFNKKHDAVTPSQRCNAKMMLNALSGNMARLPEYVNTIISINDNGQIRTYEEKTAGGESFVYIGAAITSYARAYIIRQGKQCLEQWLYSDTDSIHLFGDIPEFFKIGDKLGEWKIEKEFDKVTYYKLKLYGMEKDGKTHLTMAGVPRDTIKMLQRITDSPDSYALEGLDALDPQVEHLFDDNYDDVDHDADAEKMDVFLHDIKEMDLKAFHYTSFPITQKIHKAGTEFETALKIQWTSLSDKKFLGK